MGSCVASVAHAGNVTVVIVAKQHICSHALRMVSGGRKESILWQMVHEGKLFASGRNYSFISLSHIINNLFNKSPLS